MAKIYYKYGQVFANKSADALSAAYNYLDIGQRPMLVKLSKKGEDEGYIETRSGLSLECISFDELKNMNDVDIKGYDVVIIDNAHLMKKQDGKNLIHISDDLDIPVMCYGLITDYKGDLFDGAAWLTANADSKTEIKTICVECGKKALYTGLVEKSTGRIVRRGEVDKNDSVYCPLCRKHYLGGHINLPPSLKH